MSLDAAADEDNNEPHAINNHTTLSLSSLRAETALTLSLTQESAFFANFLSEFLRFESALLSTKPHLLSIPKHKYQKGKMAQDSLLPLGVRSVQGVEATKGRVGGEVKVRTKREIGWELSKRVGVYSFERMSV